MPIRIEQADPAYVHNGIPYTPSGAISVNIVGAINHYHQGLPFTVEGSLASVIDGVQTRIAPGGAPFDASEFLVFGTGAVDHVSAGVEYTATNQIAVF